MALNTQETDEDAYFELSFSPNVQLVSTVRRFVSEFYAQALISEDVTSRVAVATHELLENAVRYSSDGNTTIRIGVKSEPSSIRVRIDTCNRAEGGCLVTLRHTLDELIAAPDPDAHYLLLMRRSIKRVDGSGLGFGRVRAESGMFLSYRIDGDVVRIRAEAAIANAVAATVA